MKISCGNEKPTKQVYMSATGFLNRWNGTPASLFFDVYPDNK